jgi:hypothetical protein
MLLSWRSFQAQNVTTAREIPLSASTQHSMETETLNVQTGTATVAKTVKEQGAQGILACSWSPQGTPLVTSDKAGAISFWEG